MIDTCGQGNPAGLTDAQIRTLVAGGPPDPMKWLYPYDGTVFPRGMLAPTLMWSRGDGDIVYVHIHSKSFVYRGCVRTTGAQQLQLPQEVWQAAGDKSVGAADPFTIELTIQGPSGPIGPIKQRMVIAQATVKGSIYYNSYSVVGAIYRIPPGGTAEMFLGGLACYGCHSCRPTGPV